MRMLKRFVWFLVLIVIVAPSLAWGQLKPPDNVFNLPGNEGDTISFIVQDYLSWFLGIVGLIAVAYLIYGGFRYITAGGNDESAEAAKKAITNSIIGLIVIILSYLIVTVIINAFWGGV